MSVPVPRQFVIPWANSASGSFRNTVPFTSQIGILAGAASYPDGFPPLTMTSLAGGGVPPFGQDFNGVLFDISSHSLWLQAGQLYPFSAAMATAIGGYPVGTILQRADGTGFWICRTGANSNNPDTGGAGWNPMGSTAAVAVSGLTNANVTLTQPQAAQDIIVLSGTLTGSIQIIFPAWTEQWLVINNTTGAFTVTAKTASGTGVVISQTGVSAPTAIWGNGTNIYLASSSPWAAVTGTPTTLGGYGITDGISTSGGTISGNLNVTNGYIKSTLSGGTTGVVYLNAANSRYLYFDGTNYTLPSAQLYVAGALALNTGNFNSYAPTLTGTGASGTWPIHITGAADLALGAPAQDYGVLVGGAFFTTYVNTTTRPLLVLPRVSGTGFGLSITVDGVVVYDESIGGSGGLTGFAIVKPGSSFLVAYAGGVGAAQYLEFGG